MPETLGGDVRNAPRAEEKREAEECARRAAVHAGAAFDGARCDDWRAMHRQLCFARSEIARAVRILEAANVVVPEDRTELPQ